MTSPRRASLGTLIEARQDSSSLGKDLHFRRVECAVVTQDKEKTIIDRCSGVCPARSVTALLGPSGAGKTSLLDIIGQRTHILKAPNLRIRGEVALGTDLLSARTFRESCSYCPQDDSLWAGLSVREHILYAIAISSGSAVDAHDDLIEKLIDILGLSKCAEIAVGNEIVKGCSGGQKKRLSVGIELATRPELLVLDEPTSGLDSHSALCTVNVLLYTARRLSVTVLATIHQPSTALWESFNRVMILSGGRMAYAGKPGAFMSYAKALGYVPESTNINPADYALSLVTCDFGDESTKARVGAIIEGWQKQENTSDTKFAARNQHHASTRLYRNQWLHLMNRTIYNMFRDPIIFKSRVAATCFFGIYFACLNSGIRREQRYIVYWFVVFSYETTFPSMLSLLIVPSLTMDAATVSKEVGNGLYSVGMYCTTTALAQLLVVFTTSFSFLFPIWVGTKQDWNSGFLLACLTVVLATYIMDGLATTNSFISKNYVVGMIVISGCNLVFMLFNGFMVSLASMSPIIQWAHWMSPMKYAFEIIIVESVTNYKWGKCTLDAPCFNGRSLNPLVEPASGKDVLVTLAYDVPKYPMKYQLHHVDVSTHILILMSFALCFRISSYWTVQKVLQA